MLIAEKVQAKVALGEFNIDTEERMTLAQFAEGWIERYVEHNLWPGSAEKYREVMRIWQGEPPHYAMTQLGHSSIKITVDLYGHWIRTDNKRAVDGRDRAIGSAASIRKSDASNERKSLRIVK